MKAFFLLLRPVNLLIIALTMYAMRLFLVVYEAKYDFEVLGNPREQIDFALLVFSTVLIAGAGNVINDYFDVKADRINRPDKLIIGKHIKRRWGIVSHWILNGIAFLIAIWLSARNNTFWYVFIHLVSINLLWLYSLYFKKQALVGNLVIASLTALVPILCGVHFYVQNTLVWNFEPINSAFEYWLNLLVVDGYFIILMAFFAFTNNFAREIIKDLEDVEGDKAMNANTIPIRYGRAVSKQWVYLMLLAPILFFALIFFYFAFRNGFDLGGQLMVFAAVILAFICNLMAIFFTMKAKVRKELITADHFVKLSMILGIVLPLSWFALNL